MPHKLSMKVQRTIQLEKRKGSTDAAIARSLKINIKCVSRYKNGTHSERKMENQKCAGQTSCKDKEFVETHQECPHKKANQNCEIIETVTPYRLLQHYIEKRIAGYW
ncbi:MAG: hypothetical protein EZS28_041302 [Streblomastix strix]|uniref:Uncharacterized protein n=1 Tax=Streblomastix strix TaxID=222440 RepID=A0A5J4TYN3_9EUKA|nr:MAG: hypothetical protein EZS28_041302 [Streblomastix strix]